MKHPPSFSGDCLVSCIQKQSPTDITAWVIFGMIIAGSHYSALRQKTQAGQRKADRRGAAGLTLPHCADDKNL